MRHNESGLQITCVNWFRMQYPKLAPVLFAVPNGGKREKKLVKTKNGYIYTSIEGSRLKQEGVISGVADLILFYPNDQNHGLAIEMKFGSNSQSPAQKEWQKAVIRLGVRYEIINTFEKFQHLIVSYLQTTDFGKKI